MSENENRIVTLHDEKQQILDLPAMAIPVPSVGIYEGECRYYKANLEWARIIEGHVSWLATTTAWQEASGEDYEAIQQILIFLQGVEEVVTKEEMQEAICEGIECAVVKIAKRITSGVTAGYQVDEDGNVIGPGATPVEDEIEDDPDTAQDESLEARSGAALAMAKGYNSLIVNLYTFYGPDATENMPVAEAQYRIKAMYKVAGDGTGMDAAIQAYWTHRAASGSHIQSLSESEIAEVLFCEDLSVNWMFEYILNNIPIIPFAGKKIAIDLLAEISTDQQREWIEAGQNVPSTAYLPYYCVPVATEEFLLDSTYLATSAYKNGTAIHKLDHRILIEVSGKVYHTSDGSHQDFFYRVASDGTRTFMGTSGAFGLIQFNEPFGNPPQADVPFQPSGVYRVTRDVTVADDLRFRRQVVSPTPGQSFTIKFTDLGLAD